MTLDGFPRAPIFILGHKWQRLAQPFLQWQYQRPVLLYQNLRETDTVDSWFELWGGREAMNRPFEQHVVYRQPHTCKASEQEAKNELPEGLQRFWQ